ncbi:MAG: ferritin [Alphaproteobacteria bacterium]|nr:ferritin [Alphaproteobacteria bacterium]
MARAKATTTDKPAKVRKGSKTTLSEANLADLGAERLATILMDLSADSYVKRALKLELLAEAGGDSLAVEISKRLAAIGKATSRIHWRKRAAFARDLDLHRTLIMRLAAADAKAALRLMLDLLDLATPVLNRINQPEGVICDVFIEARDGLGGIALEAKAAPLDLADRTAKLILSDDHALFGALIEILAPALGPAGLGRLRQNFETTLAARATRHNAAYDVRSAMLRDGLRRLADLSGDVDAYRATFAAPHLKAPLVATEIGRRLLASGRPDEALAALMAGAPLEKARGQDADDFAERAAWEEVYLDALQANGRQDEAQRRRWAGFEATLSISRLRSFLKGLADFDDVVAEDDAKKIAAEFHRFDAALAFFLGWPDLAAASRLILHRHGAINGADEDLLTTAARRLEGSYPLAATLLLRAMIQQTLTYGIAVRYKHAAKHLLEAESLAPMIANFGEFQDHKAFVDDLRIAHGRKQGFRAELEALGGAF